MGLCFLLGTGKISENSGNKSKKHRKDYIRVEQAFDDQCTGANPRYPLMSEIKQMYLNAYYGKHFAEKEMPANVQ